jgi:hypothetical protein
MRPLRSIVCALAAVAMMPTTFVFLGLVDPAPISAPQAPATVNGIITDATSAVVDGASITLTSSKRVWSERR